MAQDLTLKLLISAKDSASSVLRGTGRVLGDLRTQIGALVAALGAWRAAESGIGAAARYEDLEVQFAGLLGSAEAARAKLEELDAAFGLRQVGAAQKLFADLTAFGLQPTVSQLKSLIDFAARTGKGAENLSGIVAQLGQAWGKEKLQYEDVLILLERGVPVWQLLSDATGRTTAELAAMASNGDLGRSAITALIAAMGQVADGASIARLTTWNGLLEATRALWDRFQREVMAGGGFDWLKTKLAEVADVLEYGINSGAAKAWGEQFGEAVTSAGVWVERLTEYARNAIGALQVVVHGVAAIINGTIATISGTLAAMIPQLNAQAAALFPNLNEALSGLKASFTDTFQAATDRARESVDGIAEGWNNINKAATDEGPKQTWREMVEIARKGNAEAEKGRKIQAEITKELQKQAAARRDTQALAGSSPAGGTGGAAGGGGAGKAMPDDYADLSAAGRLEARQILNQRRADALARYRAGQMSAAELTRIDTDIGREQLAAQGDSGAIAQKKRLAEAAKVRQMIPGLDDLVAKVKLEIDPEGKMAEFRVKAAEPIRVPVVPEIKWSDGTGPTGQAASGPGYDIRPSDDLSRAADKTGTFLQP